MKCGCLEVRKIQCIYCTGLMFVVVVCFYCSLLLLASECKIMKNRKFLGHLPEQSVRQKSKPFIVEMDDK